MITTLAEILTYLRSVTTITDSDLGLVNMVQGIADQAVKDELQYDPERGSHVEYLPLGRDQLNQGIMEDFDVTSQGAIPRTRAVGATRICVQHLPIVLDDVLEVREQFDAKHGQTAGSFGTATILTRGLEYWLDAPEMVGTDQISRSGHLIRSSLWPCEAGSIKVTYTAGWTALQFMTVASGIRMAAILTTVKAYKQAKAQGSGGGSGLISEAIGKYSYTKDARIAAMMTGMTVVVPGEALGYLAKYRNYGRGY